MTLYTSMTSLYMKYPNLVSAVVLALAITTISVAGPATIIMITGIITTLVILFLLHLVRRLVLYQNAMKDYIDQKFKAMYAAVTAAADHGASVAGWGVNPAFTKEAITNKEEASDVEEMHDLHFNQ